MSSAVSRVELGLGEPVWDIARLFPNQGSWDEEDYLALETNWQVEYADGCIEVLPMPAKWHQLIVGFLYRMLFAFVEARHLGEVMTAPYSVRTLKRKFRQPDVVFVAAQHAAWAGDDFAEGADLVMEVVSGSKKDRNRDLVAKRREYALAGIAEYWIVDPQEWCITVLRLVGRKYVVAGTYRREGKARSVVLKGFEVDVAAALASKGPRTAGKLERGER